MTEAELDKLLLGEDKPISEAELDFMLSGEGSPIDTAKIVGEGIADYTGDALSTIGSVLDYPMAPVREAVGSGIEVLKGDKTIPQALESAVTPLIAGPSQARSWSQILEDLGVPKEGGPAVPLGVEQLMTPEEIEASPKYQTSQIAASFLDQLQPVAMSKIRTPNLINRQKQAERALGLSAKQIAQGMEAGPESTRNLENITEFATESGILKPMSSSQGIFERASKKLEESGKKLGSLIDKSSQQIDDWIATASPKLREKYLDSGFNIPKIGQKMMRELSDELDGSANHDSALRTLSSWLERHDTPMKGRPSLEQMQKWKTNVGNSIKDFSMNPGKQPGKEAAYKKILQYLDEGIESEINFAENYLKKGDSLDEYRKLKKEYSISKQIKDSALKEEAAKRSAKGVVPKNVLDMILDPIYGTRMQSTLATLPEQIIPTGPMATQLRIGATLPTPFELQEEIKRDNNLKNTEKAKLLQEVRRNK